MQITPVVHRSIQMRFSYWRLEYQLLNFRARLVGAAFQLNIDIVDGPAVINESGIRQSKRDLIHHALDGGRWQIGIDSNVQVARFTGKRMLSVAVMDQRILYLNVGSRVREKYSFIRLRRRQVKIPKIRAAFIVKIHPEF